ncbi:MAG: undecaprenyldiphospho-muramoylpentapeptide beta-N-acetylglucosaminyltransferase [Gammaproteobacteria bacterium]|nr:undecaprenyldiphospho-muramoylpentapeptide beta-N-acetylglucosaminyltransferase [Gammaproteobacteria bacterium]
MSGGVLIMAGGTGGHVCPALAVAAELKAGGSSVQWLGTRRGIEARLVPQAGIPINWLSIAGLRGHGVAGWLLAPVRLLRALWQAVKVLRSVRPAVVLGMGGFASGPGGLAARLLGVPLVIHEQNALPGLTNRLLARLARSVLTGFSGAFSGVKAVAKKARWVGNPVANSIARLPPPAERGVGQRSGLRLLVLGGSQGARAINRLMPGLCHRLSEEGVEFSLWHQCGAAHLESVEADYRAAGLSLGEALRLEGFIDDMASAYGWADLVLARSGALTVAELSAAGVGAILVPYPYAVDDHQTVNAAALTAVGAGELLAESRLSEQSLVELLRGPLASTDRLLQMAEAARSLARPDAARLVAEICLELAHA